MHTKSVVVGALAAGCTVVTAQEGQQLVQRDNIQHEMPQNLKTVEPSRLSAYHMDMHSLRSKIKHDPMYTSMKDVMKTAVPQSYKDAMATNPASLHSAYKATPPGWYQSLPTDVKNFMEGNRKSAKSVYEKDIGPLPTDQPYPGGGYLGGTGGRNDGNMGHGPQGSGNGAKSPATTGKADDKKAHGSKSEGPGLSAVGAAVCALVGAFGLAALLL